MKKIKVLISNDGYHAHYFERMSWLRAFQSVNFIDAYIYDIKEPAFKVFDKIEPDIFIGQLYNLDQATIKCINNRPHMKVALRAGEYGSFETDPSFNILKSSESEFELAKHLRNVGGLDFIYTHYEQESVNLTHSKFIESGIPAYGITLCADIFSYFNGRKDPSLECDIGFVGGYWPYKGQVIDQYLLPLCYPVGQYNIKIFGNQGWSGVNQYCGHIQETNVKNLFVSSKICPNLSEPHAHKYGIEVNERGFKVLAAGGFCIGDNVASHKRIFGDGMVFADDPIDFKDKIDYYLKNPEEAANIAKKGQQTVLTSHTSYHRISEFLKLFGYSAQAKQIIDIWNQFLNQNFKEQ